MRIITKAYRRHIAIILFMLIFCFPSADISYAKSNLPKPQLKVFYSGGRISAEWNGVQNAEYYTICWKKKSDKYYDYRCINDTPNTYFNSIEWIALDYNTTYKISVRARRKDGSSSAWKTVYFKTRKPQSKIKPPKKIIVKRTGPKNQKNYKVTAKNVKGATSCEIQVKQLIKASGKKRWLTTIGDGTYVSSYISNYWTYNSKKKARQPADAKCNIYLSRQCIGAKVRIRSMDGNGSGKWSSWKTIKVPKKIKGYVNQGLYGGEHAWVRDH